MQVVRATKEHNAARCAIPIAPGAICSKASSAKPQEVLSAAAAMQFNAHQTSSGRMFHSASRHRCVELGRRFAW